MSRKESAAVDEMRGPLSVPPGSDGATHERVSYVRVMRGANSNVFGPW
jgi:hypothetical protein